MSSETRLISKTFQEISQDSELDQISRFFDRIHNVLVQVGYGREAM